METNVIPAETKRKLRTLATLLAQVSAQLNYDILSITYDRNATDATFTYPVTGLPTKPI